MELHNRLSEIIRFGRIPATILKAVLSILLLAAAIIFSSYIGAVTISPVVISRIYLSQVPFAGSYFDSGFTVVQYNIIVLIREPEILGAVFVGAALGMGGASVQSVFKNPITEPYIIGISSGATLGAIIALSTNTNVFGAYSVQLLAFISSLAVVIAVYLVSFRSGKVPPIYLLLSGIAISLFISAIVGLMLFTSRRLQNEAFAWLLGSLSGITWGEITIVALVVVASGAVLTLMSRELDALQMGEAHAQSIGVPVERTKMLALIVTTIGVSAAVSISGLIGFVGLIIPHVSRIIYGGSNRKVVPASAVLGAVFLLISNDLARTAVHGVVIPVGIVTGIIGVPFFMYLLNRISRGNYVS